MAKTNIQAFSGEVEVASNLQVGTANLFVDITTGKVGIGKTNPTQLLDIVGNVAANVNTLFVDTVTSRVGIGTSNPSTNFDVNGNVNIGSTLTVSGFRITAAAAAEDDLQAITNAGADTTNQIHITNATRAISSSTGALRVGDSGAPGGIGVVGNVYVGDTVTTQDLSVNNVISDFAVNTNDLFVDISESKVGILTTQPHAELHVVGNVYASSNLTVDTDTFHVDAENDRVGVNTKNPEASLHLVGNAFVSSNLEVGTADLFVDTVNSRVGIGKTDPVAAFEVRAADMDGQASGTSQVISRFSAGNDGVLNIFAIATSNGEENLGLQTQIDGRAFETDVSGGWSYGAVSRHNLVLQPYKGSIGIGKTDPSVLLDLKRDSVNGCTIQFESSGGYKTSIGQKSSASSDRSLQFTSYGYAGSNSTYKFLTQNSAGTGFIEALNITGDGNVGIGTVSPGYKLHVVGDIAMSGGTSNYDSSLRGGYTNRMKINFDLDPDTSDCDRMTISLHGDECIRIRRNYNSAINSTSFFGKVGIGTTQPSGKFHIKQTGLTHGDGIRIEHSTTNWIWDIFRNSSNDLIFSHNGTTKAFFDQDGGNNVDQNFTGQHRTFIKDIPFTQAGELEGLIVSADNNKYIKMSGGIETGSNAIMINESLPVVSFSNVALDKKCFGVISTSEDPDTRENRFGNIISVSEKEVGDTRVYINSVGEGAIWVTNINGSLESGDYITTSNIAGYGQRQDSEFLTNYTVAKITMDCDFDPVTQPIKIIKKELANVNYWVKTTYENVTEEEYSNLTDENRQIVDDVYQKINKEESKTEQEGWELEVRQELVNVLDEHGQIQWEDDPSGATEKAYKIRYLDANGNITDEANAVHKAAFVGCTYHCG